MYGIRPSFMRMRTGKIRRWWIGQNVISTTLIASRLDLCLMRIKLIHGRIGKEHRSHLFPNLSIYHFHLSLMSCSAYKRASLRFVIGIGYLSLSPLGCRTSRWKKPWEQSYLTMHATYLWCVVKAWGWFGQQPVETPRLLSESLRINFIIITPPFITHITSLLKIRNCPVILAFIIISKSAIIIGHGKVLV